jgi:hypothetical protein
MRAAVALRSMCTDVFAHEFLQKMKKECQRMMKVSVI